jgi:hypothetical protein
VPTTYSVFAFVAEELEALADSGHGLALEVPHDCR